MTLAGIDEAGYGPLLGPLVVGGCAFTAPGAPGPEEAASALRAALADPAHGVRVADSKRLHAPSRGPGPLEAEVLAVLVAARGAVPRDGAALLRVLGAALPPGDHPWYAALAALPLPLAADPGRALDAGTALRIALEARGFGAPAPLARPLVEGRFNAAVAARGDKASVLFDLTADAIGNVRAMAAAAGGALEVRCDRHGGRSRYGGLLSARFAGEGVIVRAEDRRRSAYRVGSGARAMEIVFSTDADAGDPAVSAASMIAKYVREVHMAALNAWFRARVRGLRPTAGYWNDGLRFLRDTAAVRRSLALEDALLVRCR